MRSIQFLFMFLFGTSTILAQAPDDHDKKCRKPTYRPDPLPDNYKAIVDTHDYEDLIGTKWITIDTNGASHRVYIVCLVILEDRL